MRTPLETISYIGTLAEGNIWILMRKTTYLKNIVPWLKCRAKGILTSIYDPCQCLAA